MSPGVGRGVIVVLVGPGGAGKNAIMKAIMAGCSEIRQLATATTRAMREGETQGVEHLFVSRERFQRMLAADQLLERQEVTPGKWYGIPRQTVRDCLSQGQIRIADIEALGAAKLAEAYPESVVQIFVTVPGVSIDERLALLERRMRGRDDGETDIAGRLQRARDLEFPYQDQCDFVVVNDRLESAIEKTRGIIAGELARRGLPIRDLPAWHRSLGARLAADDIPLDYGDQASEIRAVDSGAILLDRSHEARILLEGDSGRDLVNRMSTNHVLDLPPYQARATVFTNANARILFRALCCGQPDALLLLGGPSQGPALLAYLRRNIFFGDRVSVRDLAAETGHFALHGARADALIAALGADPGQLPAMHGARIELAGAPVTLWRRKPIAGGHWSLICPKDQAATLHRHLLAVGQPLGLRAAGSLAYNFLRIRAGQPAGLELSPDYLPLEVGLWDELSFDKGCYTGQEIIARMESRQRLAKTLVKLELSAFVAAPTPLMDGERIVGKMTSSAESPQGDLAALAVIKLGSAMPGTRLMVGDQRAEASVIDFAGAQPDFVTAKLAGSVESD